MTFNCDQTGRKFLLCAMLVKAILHSKHSLMDSPAMHPCHAQFEFLLSLDSGFIIHCALHFCNDSMFVLYVMNLPFSISGKKMR